jgi:nucleoporin POM152
VHDRFCEGVVGADKDYDVEYLSRPTLSIRFDDHMNDTSSLLHRHQGLKRQDVCVNKVDSIELLLTGAPPFTVSYDVTTPTQPRKSKTLLAVQHSATLMLLSDEPGRYVYDITGVSDSLYENPSDGMLLAQGVAHHGKSVRFEQKVVPLPSASFKASKVAPRFCVSDELGSRKADEAASTTDLVLKLEGEAPFQLELEVKPIRSSLPPQRFSAHDIQPKEWPVKLPYGFSNAGRYEVTLWSVQDANGCERVLDKSSFSSAPSFDDNTQVAIRPPSAMVDVADTANIIAVQPRQHHCVGDNLDFIMQGSPPWTISYIWEGHKREVVSRKPAFSRLAEKPGTFTVSRIAHQQNQCSTAVNIVKQIHALPSVTVSSGKNTEQDIREGDEAIIHFNFTGTPPFTFKYTRSMPTPPYEVLEEKTVA